MTAVAIPIVRGCGTRVHSGIYWECGLSPDGAPLEDFLIDVPTLIPSGLRIPPRGVTLKEIGGVWHIFDWVGQEHYTNMSDCVEEIRRFGLSRRLPRTLDFSRLTRASRILLIHARARIENASLYGPFVCPKGLHPHGTDACVGGWLHDVEGGAPTGNPDDPRAVTRVMPSFVYTAHCPPPGIAPQRVPGIFASFPASRLAVVRGGHEAALVAARRAGVPVDEVDE